MAAMDLVHRASVKIRRYEEAFAALARDITSAFDRMKSENAVLRANLSDLQARTAEAEERARQAVAALNANHAQNVQLRRQVEDLEVALEAAETHIQKSTGYISRLGAYILRSHAENDDEPLPVVQPASTVNQVEAILRRRAG